MQIKKKKTIQASEGSIQSSILDWLRYNKNLGIFWRNNSTGIWDPTRKFFRKSHGIIGCSDILGCLNNGRFCAIEVKAKGGKVSDDQKSFIDEVNKRGGLAFVAYSLDDVIQELGLIK